jgi:hypothetical protein
MRGSPMARAILTVIALLTLLFPLQSLTSHQSAATLAPPEQVSTGKKKIHLELTSTTVPFKFQITNTGEIIWSGESTSTTIAADTELKFPPEGIDLVLDVSWPQERETAVRLALTPEGSDTTVKTVWGTMRASEVLTFNPEK